MDNDVYTFALKNALNEIQNACPEVKNSFMFREDGEVVASDSNTPEKTIIDAINAFDGIFERAESIGDIEGISVDSSDGRVSVCHVNNLFLVTVTSRNADTRYVDTLNRVLIPTVLKLLEKINPAPHEKEPSSEQKPDFPFTREPREMTEEITEEDEEEPEEILPTEEKLEIKSEPPLIDVPANQLMVENLGGLLVPSDTVRIDNQMLSQWETLHGGKKIDTVEVETFDGKKTDAKVKPIKDSKYEGKGIVQMPEKIQLVLEITKGELVRVRPIVE